MKHRKIYLTLTCKCNNLCLNCCITQDVKNREVKLTFDQITEYLGRIDVGIDDIIEVSGGEPSLHEEFWKILGHLRESYKNEIALLTNAETFSSLENAQRLATQVDHVVTAIYSPDQPIHDSITCSPGSFQRKINGLRNLDQCGIKLHLKTIPMQMTYQKMEDFVRFCSNEFHQPHLIINALDIVGTARENVNAIAVRHTAVAPFVEDATDVAEQMGNSMSLFMPMCSIDPCYWDHFPVGFGDIISESIFISPTRGLGKTQTQLLRKPEECDSCILKHRCFWPWEHYLEEFGSSEINPVK